MEDSIIEREREEVVSRPKPQESEFKYTSPPPDRNTLNLSDFLNPRSMLTPGVAGSMVMLIANTLWVQFMIPQKWSALTLSFLLIIPILMKFSASIFEDLIYFVFNGLIVFALAVNTNFVGTKLQEISGVAVRASLDTQKINRALKNLPVVATTDTNQEVEKINHMQLAANDQQEIQNFRLSSTNRNVNKDSAKQDEKKKQEKNKDKSNKDNRQFFQKWF